MKYTVKEANDKEWNDKKFVEAVIVDEKGEEFKVSFWNGELNGSDGTKLATIDGELSKNDKGYWKLSTAKKAAGGAYMTAQKAQVIEKAMDKKADQIAKAQDRSAWMWAKTNAATILANNTSLKSYESVENIANVVIKLATLIYNGEPTEPFTTPMRTPHANDSQNQKENAQVFNEPLSDEELDSLSQIPF